MRVLPQETRQRLILLGIEDCHLEDYRLPYQPEQPVVDAGLDVFERPLQMTAETYSSWLEMSSAATEDNIILQVVSAFRSFDYQCQIIQHKREQGQTIGEILRVSAIPGFSEHHSGCALDLTTPGQPPLEESFDETNAFRWLTLRAADFGFSLSYPRHNHFDVDYEPWHWCWHP